MRIELWRTEAPEDMQPEHCGICGVQFVVGVVRAKIFAGSPAADNLDGGVCCEQCVEYFGNYRLRAKDLSPLPLPHHPAVPRVGG
jgi:hypothetical protein